QRHFLFSQPGRAGVDRFAVDANHALLARVGVDAGETDGEAGVAVDADPAQRVEHGLAGLVRDLVALKPPGGAGLAAEDVEPSLQAVLQPKRDAPSDAAASVRSSAGNRLADGHRGSRC